MRTASVGDPRATGVVLVAALMVLVALAATWHRLSTPSDGTRVEYLTSALGNDGLGVAPIAGVATPLRAGDRVTTIEGVGLERWLTGDPGGRAVSGETVAYEVSRDEATVSLRVPLGTYPLLTVVFEAWGTLLQCAALFAVGAYVMVRRPSAAGAAPLLLFAAGMTGSTVPWLLGFQALDLAGRIGFWLWVTGAFLAYSVMWSSVIHFGLVFPKRLAAADLPGAIPLVYAVPLALVGGSVAVSAAIGGSLLAAFGSAAAVQLVMVIAIGLTILTLQVIQYRSAKTTQARDQVRWLAWGGGIAIALSMGLWFVPELLTGRPLLPWSAVGAAGLPFPVAIATAVLRHRLFDIEVVINRSLVYGGLTVAVVAVYASVAAGLGLFIRGDGGFAVSLLATGAAALAALPVRDRLQRAVDRLMYGDRRDPYRAISRLADRLSASLATDEVLPTVVATVASALRLPYVAIELQREGGTTVVAETGRRTDDEPVRLPLVDRGEVIGELLVARRSPHEDFDAADRALLAGLAREAGGAARSVRLATEIERSRRQLVAAREEERRRLRRDLHDGLGPTLAGARLKLQAAREMGTARPGEASAIFDDLDAELAGVLDDVRRISRDLRPPALDELGLMPALRARAAQFAADAGLDLSVNGPDTLPPLPAEVEAAAYRIALEALTNVRRHSSAAHCAVRVRFADELEIEVVDDGRGIEAGTPSGVGLTSMRERASEVGGSCEITAGTDGGTRVVARLPVPAGGAA
jgi:two-component system NarL family sensor kinase